MVKLTDLKEGIKPNFSIESNAGKDTVKNGLNPMGIGYGTWYYIKYLEGQTTTPKFSCWLPVNDNVGYDFSHSWKDVDFQGAAMGFVSSNLGSTAAAGLGEAARLAGQSVHVGGSSVYSNSPPFTFSVVSEVMSGDRTGKVVHVVDRLRALSTGKLTTISAEGSLTQGIEKAARAAASKLAGAVGTGKESKFKGGRLIHPGRWNIQVITFANENKVSIVSDMKDMFCTGFGSTFRSPWYGKSPQKAEIRMTFRYAFNSYSESMKFGQRIPK